jgi:tetratricopeptide (TPR) repeat protein
MSLIMEALKKVQQHRAKESRGGPFFKQGRVNRKADKKRWFIISGSAACIIILLFFLLRIFVAPSTPPPRQTDGLVERKPAIPEASNLISETSKEAEKPAPIEEPKPSLFGVHPPLSEIVKENRPPVEKRMREKASVKPIPEREVTLLAQKEEKPVIEYKSPPSRHESIPTFPSPPPSAPKEETPSKPVALVQESGKDQVRTIEIVKHFNSGVAFYRQKELSKAIQAYEKVIELDPNHVEAYNNLGIIYQEMGDLERALTTYRRTIEINPKYEKGLNNIGILFHMKGEDEKALEAFSKVLTFNPAHIESHINLGTLYKKKGLSEKAVDSYQKALAINPRHGETHYNLGLLYEQIGKTELAIHHFEQFVLLSSETYPELVTRVRRHIHQLLKTKGVKKELK